MTSTRHVLTFFDPDAIIRLVADNPVVWHDPNITGIGGLADKLGMTPVPAVEMFLAFVEEHDRLPTQTEYSTFCLAHWRLHFHWPNVRRYGEDALGWARQKVERNFYPSMIDSFHSFGLVARAGWYDRCLLDSVADVKGKSDLTFIGNGFSARINLKGIQTRASRQAEAYKRTHRPGHDPNIHQIAMPRERPKCPGNKRWFCIEDFRCIQPQIPGGTLW